MIKSFIGTHQLQVSKTHGKYNFWLIDLHNCSTHYPAVFWQVNFCSTLWAAVGKKKVKSYSLAFFPFLVCRQSQLMRHKQTFNWEHKRNKNLTKMCSKRTLPFLNRFNAFAKKGAKLLLNNLLRFKIFAIVSFHSCFLQWAGGSRGSWSSESQIQCQRIKKVLSAPWCISFVEKFCTLKEDF